MTEKVIPYQLMAPYGTAFRPLADGSIQISFPSSQCEEVAKYFEEHGRAVRQTGEILARREAKEAAKRGEQTPAALPPADPYSGRSVEDILKENQVLKQALADRNSARPMSSQDDKDPLEVPHQTSGDDHMEAPTDPNASPAPLTPEESTV